MKEKKSILIAFRVTEKEKAKLDKIAKKSKVNLTDIFRKHAKDLLNYKNEFWFIRWQNESNPNFISPNNGIMHFPSMALQRAERENDYKK